MRSLVSLALIFVWLGGGFYAGIYKSQREIDNVYELMREERALHQQEVRRLKTKRSELNYKIVLLEEALKKKPKIKTVYKEKPVYKTVYKEKPVYRTVYEPCYRPAYEPNQLTRFFRRFFGGY